jgi:hypothetical protein
VAGVGAASCAGKVVVRTGYADIGLAKALMNNNEEAAGLLEAESNWVIELDLLIDSQFHQLNYPITQSPDSRMAFSGFRVDLLEGLTFNDLQAFADFNRSFLDAARAAKKKGQTADDFVKSWTPPTGINAPTGARLPTNVQAIYNELG